MALFGRHCFGLLVAFCGLLEGNKLFDSGQWMTRQKKTRDKTGTWTGTGLNVWTRHDNSPTPTPTIVFDISLFRFGVNIDMVYCAFGHFMGIFFALHLAHFVALYMTWDIDTLVFLVLCCFVCGIFLMAFLYGWYLGLWLAGLGQTR